MAYEKQTWLSGDVLSSVKLNHMENGIEAASTPGVVAVPISQTENGLTCGKTCQEIKDALDAGGLVLAIGREDLGTAGFFDVITSIVIDDRWGIISVSTASGRVTFSAYTDEGGMDASPAFYGNLRFYLSQDERSIYRKPSDDTASGTNIKANDDYMVYCAKNKLLPPDLYTYDGSVCRCIGMHIASNVSVPFIDSIVYRRVGPKPDATVTELRFYAAANNDWYQPAPTTT